MSVERGINNPLSRVAILGSSVTSALSGMACRIGNPSSLELEANRQNTNTTNMLRLEAVEQILKLVDFSSTAIIRNSSRSSLESGISFSAFLSGGYWSGGITTRSDGEVILWTNPKASEPRIEFVLREGIDQNAIR